jgi:hypothetical protein
MRLDATLSTSEMAVQTTAWGIVVAPRTIAVGLVAKLIASAIAEIKRAQPAAPAEPIRGAVKLHLHDVKQRDPSGPLFFLASSNRFYELCRNPLVLARKPVANSLLTGKITGNFIVRRPNRHQKMLKIHKLSSTTTRRRSVKQGILKTMLSINAERASHRRTRGMAAGRHSDGRPMTGYRYGR